MVTCCHATTVHFGLQKHIELRNQEPGSAFFLSPLSARSRGPCIRPEIWSAREALEQQRWHVICLFNLLMLLGYVWPWSLMYHFYHSSGYSSACLWFGRSDDIQPLICVSHCIVTWSAMVKKSQLQSGPAEHHELLWNNFMVFPNSPQLPNISLKLSLINATFP